MARERTRPALQNEQVEIVEREFGTGESAFKVEVEVHTFDALPFTPNDVLAAAISAGNVKTSESFVEFWSNKPSEDDDKWDADKPVKLYRQKYTEVNATSYEGCVTLVDGIATMVFDAVSQSVNRNVFQGVYIDMKNASEGPEKAIAKVQKLLKGLSPAQLEAAKTALGLA